MQKEFMMYFNFSETDLKANRKGVLSFDQIARLKSSYRKGGFFLNTMFSLSSGLVLTLLLSLVILPLWFIVRIFTDWAGLLWAIPCGLPVLLFIFLHGWALKSINDWSPPILKKTEGKIKIKKAEEETDDDENSGEAEIEIYYDLHVGDVRFTTCDLKLVNLMQKDEGEVYAIYFLESEKEQVTDINYTDSIMSLEIISNGYKVKNE